MDGNDAKPSSWWPEAIYLLLAPVLAVLCGAFKGTQDLLGFIVILLPIPLALFLSFRLAGRAKLPSAGKIVLGLLIAFPLYLGICVMSMFGCSLGGSSFNFH